MKFHTSLAYMIGFMFVASATQASLLPREGFGQRVGMGNPANIRTPQMVTAGKLLRSIKFAAKVKKSKKPPTARTQIYRQLNVVVWELYEKSAGKKLSTRDLEKRLSEQPIFLALAEVLSRKSIETDELKVLGDFAEAMKSKARTNGAAFRKKGADALISEVLDESETFVSELPSEIYDAHTLKLTS